MKIVEGHMPAPVDCALNMVSAVPQDVAPPREEGSFWLEVACFGFVQKNMKLHAWPQTKGHFVVCMSHFGPVLGYV